MAIPPEPLEELLPAAARIVDAEVVEVVSLGPEEPKPPPHARGASSVPVRSRSQVLALTVRRVLRGPPEPVRLLVQKPPGAYLARVGVRGIFLLDAGQPQPTILGRYGPDNYGPEEVEAALTSARK